MVTKKVRVIVVDDSLSIRQIFSKFLNSDPDIEVVDTATDPHDAREKIKKYNPDVITLDVEMPKMDGIAFLKKIMALRPMPVVMVSSLTQKGASVALQAQEIGAVDYIGKPSNPQELDSIRLELIRKVKMAARIKVQAKQPASTTPSKTTLEYKGNPDKRLIAIGASTGGVEAIREILEVMPANIPPIVITQHMPPVFTDSFAKRLDGLAAPHVQEAQDLMPIKAGNVYIAAGAYHLEVRKQSGQLVCKYNDGPPVSSHKPSVDVMFLSIAETCPEITTAVILTGMGRDGADGLKALRDAGTPTIGQNEATCIVYGMPKAAKEAGAVAKELPLAKIASTLLGQ